MKANLPNSVCPVTGERPQGSISKGLCFLHHPIRVMGWKEQQGVVQEDK
eukprot:CAMPEP_0115127072 /NCGR_PEP_ID=MMETSP0227-20121206/50151_1 /TAXON_ID=89957 /ORGANISM="Polarella glacialis, Strain CCMP 1383" /LENGTH=48 /DNA_ID= /DNA_START= /DNA_END= /DNA_ORIENTATION=